MQKAFNISVTIFGISLFILSFVIAEKLGATNPLFDSQYDGMPFINVMRVLINFSNAIDKLDFTVVLISGISSFITGSLKGRRIYP